MRRTRWVRSSGEEETTTTESVCGNGPLEPAAAESEQAEGDETEEAAAASDAAGEAMEVEQTEQSPEALDPGPSLSTESV